MGYRPAELHELLAFGEKYPKLELEFPIVALGSVWPGWNCVGFVPCLDGRGSKRHLDLHWIKNDWQRYVGLRPSAASSFSPWGFGS